MGVLLGGQVTCMRGGVLGAHYSISILLRAQDDKRSLDMHA